MKQRIFLAFMFIFFVQFISVSVLADEIQTAYDEESLIGAMIPGALRIVYLTQDIDLTSTLDIPTGASVTLRSANNETYTITATGDFDAISTINSNLVIDGVNISRTSGTYGRGIVSMFWHVTLLDGIISGHTAADFPHIGGGILSISGTVIIKGGEISGNTATSGGGISVSGVLIIEDGLIYNNTASGHGGGVQHLHNLSMPNSEFIMYGGKISGNTAALSGGGISPSNYITMYGGTISNNTAGQHGGGMSIFADFHLQDNRLYIGADVVFSGNSASSARMRDAIHDADYYANIFATAWTYPFSQGLNNFDLTYIDGSPVYLRQLGFELNNATTTPPITVISNTPIMDAPSFPSNPTRAGHYFDGWLLNNASALTAATIMPNNNTTVLHASWIAPEFAISITNGSTGASALPNPAAAGQTITLNAGTPPQGYFFAGWTTTTASALTVSNPTSADAASFTMPNSPVNVIASWTAISDPPSLAEPPTIPIVPPPPPPPILEPPTDYPTLPDISPLPIIPPPSTNSSPASDDAYVPPPQPTPTTQAPPERETIYVNSEVTIYFTRDNDSITIDMSITDGIDVLDLEDEIKIFQMSHLEGISTVNMPISAWGLFADARVMLAFELPHGTLTLDAPAVYSIGTQSKGAAVSLSLIDVSDEVFYRAYRVDIFSGDYEIVEFDGTIVIQVRDDSALPAGVWIQGRQGELTRIDAVFDPSTYMIAFDIHTAGIFIIRRDSDLQATPLSHDEYIPDADVLRFIVNEPTFFLNEVPHVNDVSPFIDPVYHRAMLPLRVVAENLGAHVYWQGETGTVHIFNDTERVSLVIGEPLPNGMGVAVIYSNRTFVPLRYVAEMFDRSVYWDEENRAVYLFL